MLGTATEPGSRDKSSTVFPLHITRALLLYTTPGKIISCGEIFEVQGYRLHHLAVGRMTACHSNSSDQAAKQSEYH